MCGIEAGKSLETYTQLLFEEADLHLKENEFKNLSDFSDRVDLVYNCITKLNTFKTEVAKHQDRKSNRESEMIRKQGNDLFLRQGNYLVALEYYTKSIAYAESGSTNLALAYANRSACLYERRYYKQCLEVRFYKYIQFFTSCYIFSFQYSLWIIL